ncbi:hypothetical protein [Teredinibacter sp. KSP-S5-2]|uniref:hypothetical protein n=1 Tax=Teredinibacter sp. KSP-S5-2 TaxID=3034506 RepID=UPI002934964C|nr:hypothetical protein [Teredinibacter sp. KSP-S5-2]WNO07683.1 hypothetical protein P5V12_11845 [Teredinibacter sp. KSP-S5-2]
MDQESIVYGCIKDVAQFGNESQRKQANRRAMLSLPTADEWPYLCQEMFALPRVESATDTYQTEVMHFGASYKAIEYEWEHWMKKFENLLDSMYWVSAVVHLETELSGTHTFVWESYNNGHEPGAGIQQVRCEWTHENSFTG